MTPEEKQLVDEAQKFAGELCLLATKTTSGADVAMVGMVEALCRVAIVVARSRGIDLDAMRDETIAGVGEMFDQLRKGNWRPA